MTLMLPAGNKTMLVWIQKKNDDKKKEIQLLKSAHILFLTQRVNCSSICYLNALCCLLWTYWLHSRPLTPNMQYQGIFQSFTTLPSRLTHLGHHLPRWALRWPDLHPSLWGQWAPAEPWLWTWSRLWTKGWELGKSLRQPAAHCMACRSHSALNPAACYVKECQLQNSTVELSSRMTSEVCWLYLHVSTHARAHAHTHQKSSTHFFSHYVFVNICWFIFVVLAQLNP